MAKSESILGDQRLERPHGKLVDAMIQKQRVILRTLGRNRTDEVVFGRFLRNPRINPSNLVQQFWHTHPVVWEEIRKGTHFSSKIAWKFFESSEKKDKCQLWRYLIAS